MKKQLLTLMAGALISTGVIYGQQPANADFELWEPSGSAEDPVDWSSFNEYTAMGVPTMAFKSTDVNSGTYALQVISLAAVIPPPMGAGVLDTLLGVALLGDLDLNNPGVPWTTRPSELSVYTKGTVVSGDICLIMAEVSVWNDTTMERETVGDCFYMMQSSKAAYSEEVLTFNYASSKTPDTLSITIVAGSPGSVALPGNEIFVDDITLNYSFVGIQETTLSNVKVYPNPANNSFTIETDSELAQTVSIINMQGKVVLSEKFQSGAPINIEHLSAGFYTYIIISEDRSFAKSGKLSVTR